MDPEINLKLHRYVSDILIDLAVDDDLSPTEEAEVKEAMQDLAEMLIDSLKLEVLETEETSDGLVLTARIEI